MGVSRDEEEHSESVREPVLGRLATLTGRVVVESIAEGVYMV